MADITVGARIRELRLAQGMTQNELGIAAGMETSALSGLERMRRADRQLQTLAQVAAGLRVDLADVLDLGDNRKPAEAVVTDCRPKPSAKQLKQLGIRLGRALVAARKQKGWMAREVAVLSGFSNSDLSRFEQGFRVPRLTSLRRLCAVYHLTPVELLRLGDTAELSP